MKIFGLHITTSAAIAAVKAFAGNELDNAIVAAKKTELGQAAVAAVHDLEDSALTGPERKAKAIADVTPVVLSYIARGGFTALLADAEVFAGELIESTLTDLRKTKTGQIATAVLAVAKAA